jgi:hypothetical protein
LYSANKTRVADEDCARAAIPVTDPVDDPSLIAMPVDGAAGPPKTYTRPAKTTTGAIAASFYGKMGSSTASSSKTSKTSAPPAAPASVTRPSSPADSDNYDSEAEKRDAEHKQYLAGKAYQQLHSCSYA